MDKIIRHRVTNDLSKDFKINVAKRKCGTIGVHWHDFYEIEICLSGKGINKVNGKDYPIGAGSLFFLTPTDFHSFEVEEKLSIINLTFAPYCIEYSEFSELLCLTRFIHANLDQKTVGKISSLIDIIEDEGISGEYLNQKYASHLLACILIEILRLSRDTEKNRIQNSTLPTPMQKLIYYVHTHFKEDITLKDAAEFADLSAGYVSKMFQTHLNCGFKELLTELRLKHAENLLIHSDEQITDIAYFSGFNSSTHFLRAFEKVHNMPPRTFRSMHRK